MREIANAEQKHRCNESEDGKAGRGVCRECVLLVCLMVVVFGGAGMQKYGAEELQRRIYLYYRYTRCAQRVFLEGLEERMERMEKSKRVAFESWPVVEDVFGFKSVRQLVPYETGEDIREKFYTLSPEVKDIEEDTQNIDSSEARSTASTGEDEETQPKSIGESIGAYVERRCTKELAGRKFTHCAIFTSNIQAIDKHTTVTINNHTEGLLSRGSFVAFFGMYTKRGLGSDYLERYEQLFERADYCDSFVESVKRVCMLVDAIGDKEARNILVCYKPTPAMFHALLRQIKGKKGFTNAVLFILFCEEFIRMAAAEEVALRNGYASSEEMLSRARQETASSDASVMCSASEQKEKFSSRRHLQKTLRNRCQNLRSEFKRGYVKESAKRRLMFAIFKHRILVDCEMPGSIANKKTEKQSAGESASSTAAKAAKLAKPEETVSAGYSRYLHGTLVSASQTAHPEASQEQYSEEPVQQHETPAIQSEQPVSDFAQELESLLEECSDSLTHGCEEHLFAPEEMLMVNPEHQYADQIAMPEPENQCVYETEGSEFEWYRSYIWE